MANLTYTAQGSFNQNREAIINVCIPATTDTDSYNSEMYNFSKNTKRGLLNVIFCHFRNHSEKPLQHDTFDYQFVFDVDQLQQHPEASDFNENNTDALFIFLHNSTCTLMEKTLYFDQIERLYDLVKEKGNQNQAGLWDVTLDATTNNPRKVGLSLLKKIK